MELIYNNKKTGTFAEFTVEGIDENLSESEIIDAFMERIKTFDDTKGIYLPKALLSLLEDREFDFFLLAAHSEEYCNALEQMLFVVKYNEYIIDQHNTKYNVEYVGKYKTVISFEAVDNLAIFNIPTEDLQRGVFNSSKCDKEVFTV